MIGRKEDNPAIKCQGDVDILAFNKKKTEVLFCEMNSLPAELTSEEIAVLEAAEKMPIASTEDSYEKAFVNHRRHSRWEINIFKNTICKIWSRYISKRHNKRSPGGPYRISQPGRK
ncbi:MAG: hypothetical protein HFG41_07430 [Coprococcus sp.]|nr:hypothetical protein [Coprococcus sp.]